MNNIRLKYRFIIARYMPNQIRGEFVNIGIVLHLLDTQQLMTRWLPNLGRMRCLSPGITNEDYKHFQNHINEQYKLDSSYATLYSPGSIVGEPVSKASPELLDYLHREWSVPFQFSEPVAGFTTNPRHQLEHLYNQLVQPLEEEEVQADNYGVAKLKSKIERELKRANLLGEDKIQQSIEVPGKTRPWPFHFGRVNGTATLIQAVLLDQKDPVTKSDRAIVLSGRVKDVIAKELYYEVKAYAVIKSSRNPDRMDGLTEAQTLLQENQIITLTEDDLPTVTGDLQRLLTRTNHFIQSSGF